MEFDSRHHFYFYDTDLEEDLDRCAAPSEDIWKKFELVTSPRPLSGWPSGGGGVAGTMGSELGLDLSPPMKVAGPWAEALSSMVLLRDCMWSGFSTRECLEKVITERLATSPQRVNNQPKLEPDPDPPETMADHTEPATLLMPCPLPDAKVSASSGSDSPSDSEEDEIDVVTVGKRRSRNTRKPVTITVHADLLGPCMKRFHISIHQQQHNYAARSPPDPSPPPAQLEDLPEAPSPLPCSPKEEFIPGASSSGSSGSDGEELVKKKNHNFMERKRRNDLRSRFLALRDEVPGLAKTSKPPKVVILGGATTFLQSLVSRERRLAQEKEQLLARQKHLQKLVARLKGK